MAREEILVRQAIFVLPFTLAFTDSVGLPTDIYTTHTLTVGQFVHYFNLFSSNTHITALFFGLLGRHLLLRRPVLVVVVASFHLDDLLEVARLDLPHALELL